MERFKIFVYKHYNFRGVNDRAEIDSSVSQASLCHWNRGVLYDTAESDKKFFAVTSYSF